MFLSPEGPMHTPKPSTEAAFYKGGECMNIAEPYVSKLLTIFDEIVKRFEFNYEEIGRCEGETTDLLHEIELGRFLKPSDGTRIYRRMRYVRQLRRKAKDENEQLQELYETIKGQGELKKRLQGIQGRIRQISTHQDNRVYTPRVLDDLTCTDKKPEANRPLEAALEPLRHGKPEVNREFEKAFPARDTQNRKKYGSC
jgi:hypothetical protein